MVYGARVSPTRSWGDFWDGRATGENGAPAADQAQGPSLNPLEQAVRDAMALLSRACSGAYAHLHRLGANHHQVPANRPRGPVHNDIRDGALTQGECGGQPNYWPNSVAGAPAPDPQHQDPAWQLGQTIVDRYDPTVDHDDYTQAGNLSRMFDEGQRDRLTTRIAGGLGQARKEVQLRQVGHLSKADPDYGSARK